MHFPARRAVAAITCVVSLAFSLPAAATGLTVGGTGMGLGLMAKLGEAFAASPDGVEVKVLPSLGSSGGIRALNAGAIDLAVSARPLKDKEKGKGSRAIALARTPFVLVTSHQHPGGIRREALAAMFMQDAPVWPDDTPVRVVLRQENDSDNAVLANFFPGMAEALARARTRPFIPVARNDQENLSIAMRMEGSLTAASLMQVLAEEADVRLIDIDGVAPTVDNLSERTYSFFKTLYVVFPAQPRAETNALLRYARSVEARRILWEAGAALVD